MRRNSQYFSEYLSEEILPAFINNPSIQKRTAGEYFNYIRLICDYVKKDFLMINCHDAEMFFHEQGLRYHNGTLARKTIHVRLSCYLSFSRFIEANYPNTGFKNPFINVRRQEVDDRISVNKLPSMQEMDLIMSSAKQEGNTYYIILALIGRCGMAVGDVLQLTDSRVGDEGGRLFVILKENNDNKEQRKVILPSDVSALLSSYMYSLSTHDQVGHLFYNKRGKHMSIYSFDRAITRIMSRCLPGCHYTATDIRARGILELRKAGIPMEQSATYVGITPERMGAYYAANLPDEKCPADLTNYQLVI